MGAGPASPEQLVGEIFDSHGEGAFNRALSKPLIYELSTSFRKYQIAALQVLKAQVKVSFPSFKTAIWPWGQHHVSVASVQAGLAQDLPGLADRQLSAADR